MNKSYRYEIKFVLDNSRYSDAILWLYNKTTATEKYKERQVNSIYFDDINYSSIRDNLAGISQRNKLRLRWYDSNEHCYPFFEVKTKNGRLGYKTTYPVRSIQKNPNNYKPKEITSMCVKDLLMQEVIFDNHLIATLKVNYTRKYYETIDGIRITIDQKISFKDLQLNSIIKDIREISHPFGVMEIKFDATKKNSVAKLINSLHMSPKRHSKYLIGIATMGYATYI